MDWQPTVGLKFHEIFLKGSWRRSEVERSELVVFGDQKNHPIKQIRKDYINFQNVQSSSIRNLRSDKLLQVVRLIQTHWVLFLLAGYWENHHGKSQLGYFIKEIWQCLQVFRNDQNFAQWLEGKGEWLEKDCLLENFFSFQSVLETQWSGQGQECEVQTCHSLKSAQLLHAQRRLWCCRRHEGRV